jgi:hypothetical protein
VCTVCRLKGGTRAECGDCLGCADDVVDDPACGDGHAPFIDKYTRMVTVIFSLYNPSDFDTDNPEGTPDLKTHTDDGIDDHILNVEVAITVRARAVARPPRSPAANLHSVWRDCMGMQGAHRARPAGSGHGGQFAPSGHMEKYARVVAIS